LFEIEETFPLLYTYEGKGIESRKMEGPELNNNNTHFSNLLCP
jgi:hypothetical protein